MDKRRAGIPFAQYFGKKGMLRSFFPVTLLTLQFRVVSRNSYKQFPVTGGFAQEFVTHFRSIQAQSPDSIGGKIFVDETTSVVPVLQVTECPAPGVYIRTEARLIANGECWMAVEHVPQQRGPAARSANDKNRGIRHSN